MTSTRQRRRLSAITEAMTITNPLAAGIDIGSRFHAVAIPSHLVKENCRTFGVTTPDLLEMAAWLNQYGITSVVLESTGNYWVQPFRILEKAGLHAIVVNPGFARQAKRSKYSDLDDSVWLQLMHSYGLLPDSFQPTEHFIDLRTLWRHREHLIAESGSVLQKMQDALELMNIQLHKAISDISGVSGLKIIRAIVAGERDPNRLVLLCDYRLKCSREDMIKALTGDYRKSEIFVLKQRLENYDSFQKQIVEVDVMVEEQLSIIQEMCPPPLPVKSDLFPDPTAKPTTGKPNISPLDSPRKDHSKMEPKVYDWHSRVVAICGSDPTRICGLSVLNVLSLIAELGNDVNSWESAKQFTAWLGLAPNHQVTGGKVIKRQTRRGKPKAAHVFYMAALSVAKSKTPLGDLYHSQKASIGTGRALNATARKIGVFYYNLLKYGPEFVEVGIRHLEINSDKRKRRQLKRLAKELNVDIVEKPSAV